MRAWAIAIAGLLLAACGGDRPAPSAPDGAHWHPLKPEAFWYPPLPGSYRELAVLDAPEATHVTWDGPAAHPRRVHRLFVNIQADASIYFKGHSWSTRESDLEEALQKFEREITVLTHAGIGDTYAYLRFDRSARWRVTRPVLTLFHRVEFRIRKIEVAVTSLRPESAGWDPHLAGEWLRTAEAKPPPAGPPLSIAIEGGAANGAGSPAVRLRCGGASWVFPDALDWYRAVTDEAGTRESLAAANRIWAGLEAAARTAKSAGAAAVELVVGDDVPWAFVVEVIDIGIGAGLPDIRIHGTDLALHFEPGRPPPPSFVPGDPDPRDWSIPTALAIGVAAAVAFFAFSRWSLRARPRTKKAA